MVTTDRTLDPQVRITSDLLCLNRDLFSQFTSGRYDDCSNVRSTSLGISLFDGKIRVFSENVLNRWNEETKGLSGTSTSLRNAASMLEKESDHIRRVTYISVPCKPWLMVIV